MFNSPYCYDTKDDTVLTDLRQKLQAPEGFVVANKRGYLFTKDLEDLPVEDFCNRLKLKKYFSEPLNLLVNWATENKKSLRKTAEGARK
jgi:hypothetical protein